MSCSFFCPFTAPRSQRLVHLALEDLLDCLRHDLSDHIRRLQQQVLHLCRFRVTILLGHRAISCSFCLATRTLQKTSLALSFCRTFRTLPLRPPPDTDPYVRWCEGEAGA